MIMIDVFVPHLYRAFDFEVNEKSLAEDTLNNIKMITEKYLKTEFETPPKALFDFRQGVFLKKGTSLCEQGITNGDRLILI